MLKVLNKKAVIKLSVVALLSSIILTNTDTLNNTALANTVNNTEETETAVFTKNISVRSGEIKKIKSLLGAGEKISSIGYVNQGSVKGTIAHTDYDDTSNTLVIHGINKGEVVVNIITSSCTVIKVVIKVKGITNKTDKGGFNKIATINKVTNTKNFKYTTSYLSGRFYKNGKPTAYELYTAKVLNRTKKEITPDVTVKFYTKKKKLLGSYTLSKADGMTIHVKLKPGEEYLDHMAVISASELGLNEKEFNSIYYWKIV